MNEDKLKIAVYLDKSYCYTEGGGFSYYESLIDSIDGYKFSETLEICFIIKVGKDVKSQQMNKPVLYIQYPDNIKYTVLVKLKRLLSWTIVSRYLSGFLNKKINYLEQKFFSKQLIKHRVHLIYYPKPGLVFQEYPFIMTTWDIGHRTLPPFPEVAMNGIYEKRTNYFRNILNKAFLILVESKQGKKELVEYYNFDKNKIKVLPMFPGRVVYTKVVREQMDIYLENWGLLEEQFFFYPAQFWSHKNHYNLIIAFSQLIIKYPQVKLVFTGIDKGNEKYIRRVCENMNLTDSVFFLGFVSTQELYTLYKNTLALVMPTFLGPTNMPLLEADALGTPVLCSDLAGHREQMEDRAVYFNPASVDEIERAMVNQLTNERQHLKPKKHLVRIDLLDDYFNEIIPIRFAFGFEFNQR